MKGLKKVLALVLAVCMLIGMPLSVNVSASGEAPVVKAFVMPEQIADATGLDAQRSIMLCFNKDVTLDLSKISAAFGFVSTGSGSGQSALIGSDSAPGNTIRHNATIVANPAFGSTNNYVVTLPAGYTVSDFVAAYNVHSLKAYYGMVVRLYDSKAISTEQQKNNFVDGIAYDSELWPGSTKTNKYCQDNANIGSAANNLYDYIDIPLTFEADTLTLASAEWAEENQVEVVFSQAITKTSDNFYSGMRIVNSKNETVIYRPDADVKYATEAVDGAERLEAAVALTDGAAKVVATVTEKSTVAIEGFAADSVKTYSWFKAHLEACKAENPDDTFRIVYVIENAEQDNAYINDLIATSNGNPLLATYFGTDAGCAAAMIEIGALETAVYLEQVTIKSEKNNTATWNELVATFSKPVTIPGDCGGRIGLGVVLNGAIESRISLNGWTSPSAGGTSDTWTFRMGTSGANSIATFINNNYTLDKVNQGAQLCFFIFDGGADTKDDEYINAVKTAGGKLLHSSDKYPDGRDALYVPIGGFIPTAYLANDSTILVSTQGLPGVAGLRDNAYLRAYDEAGNLLTVGEAAAQWKLNVKEDGWYKTTANGQTQYVSASLAIAENLGVSTYSGIVELLNENYPDGYNLELVVEDSTKDGVVDGVSKYDFTKWRYVDALLATPKYSTVKDTAVIPFGEIVTIDNVTVDEQGQMLVTFSHDIDVDHFLAKLANYSDFFLTISEEGADSFVTKQDGNPLAQTPVGAFKKVSDNQIVGYVNPTKYNEMMEIFNAKTETDNWAIRMRIEMPTGWDSTTGELPLLKDIAALDDTVLSPFVTVTKDNRIWADVESCAELQTIEVKDWMATITGENSFTFEWTKPVNLGSGYRGIRYVDENGKLLYYNADTDTVSTATDGTALQWSFTMQYADDTKAVINAHLGGAGRLGVYSLADLIDPAADSEWGKIKAKYDGTLKVCMEEGANTMQGFIDTFQGIDGTPIMAHPLLNGNDGVYLDIQGEIVRGDLSVLSVKAINDAVIEVTFSAPIEILSNPYTALRIYKDNTLMYYNTLTGEFTTATKQVDADGKPVYKDADGNPTSEPTNADGSVKYAQIDNTPMQWPVGSKYTISEDKRVVCYAIPNRNGAPVNGISDILTYDWASVGGKVYFVYEEQGTHKINYNLHVNNIVRADDSRIALDGNFFPGDAPDRVRFEVPMEYTPVDITAKAKVISDTQIRVDFSHPVNVDGGTYMAVRMLDKDNKLMWSGEENYSVAYQWAGTWKYANDAKTAIIWTFNPTNSIWGAKNLYDLLNWEGPLARFKNEGTFHFVMEEKDTSKLVVGRLNKLVETISSIDGTNHLIGNGGTGYDNLVMTINGKTLAADELKLESVTAVDEHTMKVKFNRDVYFKEGDEEVSMAIRYLTESGDSETLTDGKTAIFNGDWKYDGDDKSTIIWTLNSKHTDSLTEILTYSGKFKWNSSARCAFVIMDQNKDYYCPYRSMRINGVTDLSGTHHLVANYITDDQMRTQMDITVDYELPTVTIEPEQKIEYYTDYMNYILVAAGLALAFVVVAVIVIVSKKKAR